MFKHVLIPLATLLMLPASLSIAADPGPEIWDLDALSTAPAFRWDDEKSSIRSLIYEGATIDGKATEVFAFYADPSTVGMENPPSAPYPAVVCIHGGGGTAFAEWIDLWARRGYAAISMDLSGRRPAAPDFDPKTGALKPSPEAHKKASRTKLERGGLDHTHDDKFASVGGSTDDDWPYHAVTNVILAHSLIASFDQVDADRTAVTGISWGGYTTCLVASIDSRFKAAVPVYGCGFLHEGESIQKPAIDALDPEKRQLWIDRYDPGSHLPKCQVPILFVNGTNDVHYVLDSYAKSFNAVPDDTEKNIRIEVKMRHGHQPGWEPAEIGLFIDAHCRDGKALPSVTSLSSEPQTGLRATYLSETAIAKAELHYTIDTGLRAKREWQSAPLSIDESNHGLSGKAVPAAANTWFISLTDDRDAMITSAVQFSDQPSESANSIAPDQSLAVRSSQRP